MQLRSDANTAFLQFQTKCRQFGMDPPNYHPVHMPCDFSNSDADARKYQAASDKLCMIRNERCSGDVVLRQLNSIQGRENCTSLSVQILRKHITKSYSLELGISDDADAQLPKLTWKNPPDRTHATYMECEEDGSIPGLGPTFKKDMFQPYLQMSEFSQTGQWDQLRDLKGFPVDVQSVLSRCDLNNQSETNMQLNFAIIDALQTVQANIHGMIIGLLCVETTDPETDESIHHQMMFSMFLRGRYLTVTEPHNFQGGTARINAEYGGLWAWDSRLCRNASYVDIFPLTATHCIVWDGLLGDLMYANVLSNKTADKFNSELLLEFFSKRLHSQLSGKQKLELFIDFLNAELITSGQGPLQYIKDFLTANYPVDHTKLMQLVFAEVQRNRDAADDIDHEEAVNIFIFKAMRTCCIRHPVQGTVSILYRKVHRNALLRRYVLALHHNGTQQFKQKATALFHLITSKYVLEGDELNYASQILLYNDYIVSIINNTRILLVQDSVNPKLCAELGMIVAASLGFDLARYHNEDSSAFDTRKAAECFKYQSRSGNASLKGMFVEFTPRTILNQQCVLADRFLNMFGAAAAEGDCTQFALHDSFDRVGRPLLKSSKDISSDENLNDLKSKHDQQRRALIQELRPPSRQHNHRNRKVIILEGTSTDESDSDVDFELPNQTRHKRARSKTASRKKRKNAVKRRKRTHLMHSSNVSQSSLSSVGQPSQSTHLSGCELNPSLSQQDGANVMLSNISEASAASFASDSVSQTLVDVEQIKKYYDGVISNDEVLKSVEALTLIYETSKEYQERNGEFSDAFRAIYEPLRTGSNAAPASHKPLQLLYQHPAFLKLKKWGASLAVLQSTDCFVKKAKEVQLALDSVLEMLQDPFMHLTIRIIKSLHIFLLLSANNYSQMVDDKDASDWIRNEFGFAAEDTYKINRIKHLYYSSCLCIFWDCDHLLLGMKAWSPSKRPLGMLRLGITANVVVALVDSAEIDKSKKNQAFVDKYLKC